MTESNDTPVVDVLAAMTAASLATCTLDADEAILVRLAALVALDAPVASYLFHFGPGAEAGLTLEDAQQVLVVLAPVVGSARIVSAANKMAEALGLALALVLEAAAEEAEEEELEEEIAEELAAEAAAEDAQR